MTDVQRYDHLSPVILAGGSGTRLWPMSRRTYPKHLIALTGGLTLLQQCAERTRAVAPGNRIVTVGAVDQGALIAQQLKALDPELAERIVLEPAARNTAAACCAAALHATALFGPAQILWVCAADHVIDDTGALIGALDAAMVAAAQGRIVTFGIEPRHPEPGFGYIEQGAPIDGMKSVHDVRRFVEKPTREVAASMIEAGGHLWNSGMFVFRADVLLEELGRFEPAILEQTTAAMAQGSDADGAFVPAPSYASIPSAPIDKAVMERSARVAVVPCDPGWSDVGSWRAVWETLPRDADGNATQGDVLLEGAEDCLVVGGERLVAAVGVRDLAIVDTGDAVMVADRDDAAAVKAVVEALQRATRPESEGFPIETTPWGERRIRLRSAGLVVSELTLRAHTTAVIEAAAQRTLFLFGSGSAVSLEIPALEHRTVTNDGDEPLVLVEVSVPA